MNMFRVIQKLMHAMLFIPLLLFTTIAAQKLVVRVDGRSCAYCAYSLEKNLQKLEGVQKVEQEKRNDE